MTFQRAFLVLVVAIPAAYAALAYAVAVTTQVFERETIPKFVAIYFTVPVVTGLFDLYRMRYQAGGSARLAPLTFVLTEIRFHLLTPVIVAAGVLINHLADIETGWPIVLAFFLGPLTMRVLFQLTFGTVVFVFTRVFFEFIAILLAIAIIVPVLMSIRW